MQCTNNENVVYYNVLIAIVLTAFYDFIEGFIEWHFNGVLFI